MSAITLDNVSKRYGDVHALRPLSVEFPSGKLSTIFGKSGSGKTTLLSVIAGLLKPTTGAIWYQNKDSATLTKDECAALRRTDIGVVFQDHNIINELTVLENVRLPLEANGMSRTAAITASEQALAKVGIGHLGRRFPAEISGGERQRVGIARAIAGTRTVLLADEPSGALDSENSTKLFKLLHQLTQEGSTVLCVTHDPLAIQYSDQVFSMDAGVLSPISHHDISQTYDFLR